MTTMSLVLVCTLSAGQKCTVLSNSPNNRVREVSQANALAMMINFCVFNLKLFKRQDEEEDGERSLFFPF